MAPGLHQRHKEDQLAMFSYHRPRARVNQNPRAIERRRALPYGCYFTWDGQAVLFNRRYKPIFRRWPDGHVERDRLDRWVDGIFRLVWFYNDSVCNAPATLAKITAIQLVWERAAAGALIDLDLLLPPQSIINRKLKKAA
jgi:hypothetical protein